MDHTWRKVGDQIVAGVYLQAFIKNGNHYFVTEIKIYKDGMIDCWGLVDLEGFKQKVRSGWVRTCVPEGTLVSMMASGLSFTVSDVNGNVEAEEFIKEVEDELCQLNDQPSTHALCQEAMQYYRELPTEENKERLRQRYEAVPKHQRIFLGDMDSRDWEYHLILDID